MRSLASRLIWVVVFGVVVGGDCFAQDGLRVNEAAAQVQVRTEGCVVTLPVVNPAGQVIAAHVLIELVDPDGTAQVRAEQEAKLATGLTKLEIALPALFKTKTLTDAKELVWYRVRYTITADGGTAPVVGIFSVGASWPAVFDLQVVGPAMVRESGHYLLHVRAIHPLSGRGVAGVAVQGALDTGADDAQTLSTKAAVTDRRGFATLEVTLPKRLEDSEIDVVVTGKLGAFSEEADGTIRVNHFSSVSVSTDKPMYQPGQTLHVRLMAFDNDKKAIADEPVTVRILDPDETVVTRSELKTSRFGIASSDWPIPGNLRLGTYRIETKFGEGRFEDAQGRTEIKISRYELPSFSVAVKPDRAYYLPGQNAEVEVRADYLFGETVRRGHVRVVRETDRKWNYREQKWDKEEGAAFAGETDESGRYVAKIDLAEEQKDLTENDYQRFRDISYAAYFTDASTGKTEQRRFDLRVTKDAIHVYVIGDIRGPLEGLPLEFYISTDYADGTPASCDVEIRWHGESATKAAGVVAEPPEQKLLQVRTNRYGVAKVSNVVLPGKGAGSGFTLNFAARGRNGEQGLHSEATGDYASPGIRVETDKTLYKPGEPVVVRLLSGPENADATVVVEAVHDFRALNSKVVHLRHGRAEVVFESAEKYEGEINILAYTFGGKLDDYNSRVVSGSRSVLFPKDRELKVGLKLSKSVYRPGDEAVADVRVTGTDGREETSALGLVVVDKAVEERERTDREFGGRSSFYNFLGTWGDTGELNGVRRSDLDKIDMTKPVPEGLELVAEILLQENGAYPETFSSDSQARDLHKLFACEIDPLIDPLRAALESRYEKTEEYPKTEAELEQYLAAAGFRLNDIADPWGMHYQARFRVEREFAVLEFVSAGPDKQFGTDDDFVVATMKRGYFIPSYRALLRAVNEYHARTGGYIRDLETLKTEMRRLGVEVGELTDPWGRAYCFEFGVDRTRFTIQVQSGGPSGHFSASPNYYTGDDFLASTVAIDYFASTQKKIDTALARYFKEKQSFPEDLQQLQAALEMEGWHWEAFQDPWGHAYYATFATQARYSDNFVDVETYDENRAGIRQQKTIVPVTQQINWIYVRSAGEDGTPGTADDFNAATFSRAFTAQSSEDKAAVAIQNQVVLAGVTGAIGGVVTDTSGASIQGAEVTANEVEPDHTFSTKTNAEGVYLLRNVAAGSYTVHFYAPGFRAYRTTNVPVRSSSRTELNVTLNVGGATETVEVSAENVAVQTSSASMAALKPGVMSLALLSPLATPRLREYFPETLLWRPEVLTDDKGRTRVKFSLADNITTWKLSAVASTLNGELGSAEKDIRAFQPFFVEHDPPRFLTVGDEIALPVVLRNYLERPLDVKVAMKPAEWFRAMGPTEMRAQIARGDSAREIFAFKAVTAVKGGKQEVSAVGGQASDAISRQVTVRPNGEEKTETASQVFRDAALLEVNIPETAIAGSLETTLKIYPNLNAHVLESIEAILERPYGCGEQTISSGYPSVLFLKYAKAAGVTDSPTLIRARRYAQLAYERLLAYRAASGGFTYWGKGESDLALTVYAIKFLRDAREFVAVDDEVIETAESWVLNRVQKDGHWSALDWNGKENEQRSVILTAYIARTMGQAKQGETGTSAGAQTAKLATRVLQQALVYLRPQMEAIDEPYLIANYALLALAVGDNDGFSGGVARLRKLEKREGETSYWSLEMNTPFYGWGLTGRVETTALVMQALARSARDGDAETLLSRGLLFLLRNEDHFGVWYSTSATINVLETMAMLSSRRDGGAASLAGGATSVTKATITVDGQAATEVDLPQENALVGPTLVDISKFVGPGKHEIGIRRVAGSSSASVQAIADYYVPWTAESAESDLLRQAKAPDALRLAVHFDKQTANIGEIVKCSVAVERIGFRGYGMLLAEIGLPPGAEVDRGSLDETMKSSGWDISSYDVLPDRLVLYLWPHAGGTEFSFTFKPRYGVKAQSAPSILYDYYNPEAHAVVAPTQFQIH
jgi:hypothetical protein